MPSRHSVAALVVLVVVTSVVAVGGWLSRTRALPAPPAIRLEMSAVPDPTTTTTTTTAPTTTTSTVTTVAARPAPSATRPPATRPPLPRPASSPAVTARRTVANRPAPRPVLASGDSAAYQGLGTWVDVFDFDPDHTNGRPPSVTPAAVDAMAAAGVRTLYLQAARPQDPASPGDLVQPDLLAEFLSRAHAHGMRVVGWYLPYLSDVGDDLRHLTAMLGFAPDGGGFDSVAVDIEWRNAVPDAAARSAQLVELSHQLRSAAGSRSLGAIVMPPVVTDVINPGFWPAFPWHEIAPYYDVWLPMAYWTNRTQPEYRDAYRYTTDNVRMLRNDLGQPEAVVHVIGGIGNAATAEDYQGFAQAAAEQATVGRSVYDWATTGADVVASLGS